MPKHARIRRFASFSVRFAHTEVGDEVKRSRIHFGMKIKESIKEK